MQCHWTGEQGSHPFIKETRPLGVSRCLLLCSALKRQKKRRPTLFSASARRKASCPHLNKLCGWFRAPLNLRWERRRPSGSRIYSFISFHFISLHLCGVSLVPTEGKTCFLKGPEASVGSQSDSGKTNSQWVLILLTAHLGVPAINICFLPVVSAEINKILECN